MGHPLFVHRDVQDWVERHPELRGRAEWVLAEMATRGIAGRPKGVVGPSRDVADLPGHHWRRSGIGGFEYYAWWIVADAVAPFASGSRVVRAVRQHDEMGGLGLGDRVAYVERAFAELEPLNEEQRAVVQEPARVRLVVGHPGTGKTGALLYVAVEEARHAPQKRLLYVTLSDRLADDARTFLSGVAELGDRVDVRTYEELLSGWTTDRRQAAEGTTAALAEERTFRGFAADQPVADLGPWKGAVDALWVEVRAHIVGRALPFAFEKRNQRACPNPLLDRDGYRGQRYDMLDGRATRQAWILAERFSQKYHDALHHRAWSVLSALTHKGLDRYLREYAGVVVDEIQDLTLLQLAVLVEAVRRMAEIGTPAPCFVAAGDESQIVHPSGFDWGICKDLLTERLGVEPRELQLITNQRSPAQLVEVCNRTAALYEILPKSHRPRASVEAKQTEAANGRVYYCSAEPDDPALSDWLDALIETPGAAVLTCRAPRASETITAIENPRYADRRFEPSLLKGLDRQYVVVWGASEALRSMRELAETAHTQGKRDPRFLSVRQMIDELRVAISRASETLVLFDDRNLDTDALVKELLAGGLAERASPRYLADELRSRGYDPLEMARSLLDEAAQLTGLDDARALRSLARADGALANLHDPESRLEALEQAIEVRRALARRLKNVARADASQGRYADVAELYDGIVTHLLEGSKDDPERASRRQLYEVLATRYRELPPGSEGAQRDLPRILSRYIEAIEQVPDLEQRPRTLEEARLWRDELSGLTLDATDDLADAADAAQKLAGWSGQKPDQEAATELRRRQVRVLLDRSEWQPAERALAQLPQPPPAELSARCQEGLGQWRAAAELWQRAEQPRQALDAFRQSGDLGRAAELAGQCGEVALAHHLSAAAELSSHADLLSSESIGLLTDAERAALARSLRDAADRLQDSANTTARRPPRRAGR